MFQLIFYNFNYTLRKEDGQGEEKGEGERMDMKGV